MIFLEKVLYLCGSGRWSIAYRHPVGHRTSNMLDLLMRGMNRYFYQSQHLHLSLEACRLHCRAWALLCNFRPGTRRWRGKTKAVGAPPNDLTSTDTMTVAAKSIDLRIAWGIPTSSPPKSVTSGDFIAAHGRTRWGNSPVWKLGLPIIIFLQTIAEQGLVYV